MTYPQPGQPGQPGGWPDQSWPNPEPHQDPAAQASPYSAQPYSAQPYATPGYQQPGYVPQPYPVYAQTKSTNGLAIAALVCSIAGVATCGVTGIVGAILGHIARKQISERGEDGDGLALAGIIVGWIIAAGYALFVVGYLILVGTMFANIDEIDNTDYGNVFRAVGTMAMALVA